MEVAYHAVEVVFHAVVDALQSLSVVYQDRVGLYYASVPELHCMEAYNDDSISMETNRVHMYALSEEKNNGQMNNYIEQAHRKNSPQGLHIGNAGTTPGGCSVGAELIL